MDFLRALDVSASGLTAERLRLDVIANNIANATTTRTADGGPYRRRTVVLAAREGPGFDALLRQVAGAGRFTAPGGRGVAVVAVAEDGRPFKLRHEPSHPDADAAGYVRLPNVDVVTEMVDMIAATRAYEAGVSAMGAAKAIVLRTLEIGR